MIALYSLTAIWITLSRSVDQDSFYVERYKMRKDCSEYYDWMRNCANEWWTDIFTNARSRFVIQRDTTHISVTDSPYGYLIRIWIWNSFARIKYYSYLRL